MGMGGAEGTSSATLIPTLFNTDLEASLDEISDDFADLEAMCVAVAVTADVDMENANSMEMEGIMSSVKDGASAAIAKVKAVIDKIIAKINEYINKVLDKMDDSFLKKNEATILDGAKLADKVKVKTKMWTTNTKIGAAETTDKIVDDLDKVISGLESGSSSDTGGATRSLMGNVDDKKGELEVIKKYFYTEKDKEYPLKTFANLKYIEIWRDGRKEKDELNKAIAALQKLKKTLDKSSASFDRKSEGGDAKAKIYKTGLGQIKKSVNLSINLNRTALALCKERRSSLKGIFGKIITEVKKQEREDKKKD
jgi:hypothetical protein